MNCDEESMCILWQRTWRMFINTSALAHSLYAPKNLQYLQSLPCYDLRRPCIASLMSKLRSKVGHPHSFIVTLIRVDQEGNTALAIQLGAGVHPRARNSCQSSRRILSVDHNQSTAYANGCHTPLNTLRPRHNGRHFATTFSSVFPWKTFGY